VGGRIDLEVAVYGRGRRDDGKCEHQKHGGPPGFVGTSSVRPLEAGD
jgi:hypothetical protein